MLHGALRDSTYRHNGDLIGDPPQHSAGTALLLLAWLTVASLSLDTSGFDFSARYFIGHADQANIADLARSFARGRGLVVNNHWLMTGGGTGVTTFPHAEPYWSIYVGATLGVVFDVVGAGRGQMLLAASLIKAATASIVFFALRRASVRPAVALGGAFVILFHSTMAQRVNGLSDIYFAFALTGFAVTLVQAHQDDRWMHWAGAGLFAALAAGYRVPGFSTFALLLAVLLLAAVRGNRQRLTRSTVALGVATTGISPFLIYNLEAFGSFLPPGYRLVRRAWLISVAASHNRGFFDPRPVSFEDLGLTWFDRFLAVPTGNLRDFLVHGLLDGGAIPVWLLALGLSAVVLVAWSLWQRSELPSYGGSHYGVVFAAGLALALAMALTVHYEARYWSFLVSLGVLAGLPILERSRLWRMGTLLIIVASAFSFIRLPNHPDMNVVPHQYEQASEVVPDDAVVMTADPWEFAYHTELPSVVLPHSLERQTILAVARRYSADYLVIIGRRVRHPGQRPWASGEFPEYLDPILVNDDLLVLRIDPGARAARETAAALDHPQRHRSSNRHEPTSPSDRDTRQRTRAAAAYLDQDV